MGSGQVKHISYQEDQAHYHRSPLETRWPVPWAQTGADVEFLFRFRFTGYNQSLLLKLKNVVAEVLPLALLLCKTIIYHLVVRRRKRHSLFLCFQACGSAIQCLFFISIVITVNFFSMPISSYKRIIFSDALSRWHANQMLSLRGVSCCGFWGRTATYLNRCSPTEM